MADAGVQGDEFLAAGKPGEGVTSWTQFAISIFIEFVPKSVLILSLPKACMVACRACNCVSPVGRGVFRMSISYASLILLVFHLVHLAWRRCRGWERDRLWSSDLVNHENSAGAPAESTLVAPVDTGDDGQEARRSVEDASENGLEETGTIGETRAGQARESSPGVSVIDDSSTEMAGLNEGGRGIQTQPALQASSRLTEQEPQSDWYEMKIQESHQKNTSLECDLAQLRQELISLREQLSARDEGLREAGKKLDQNAEEMRLFEEDRQGMKDECERLSQATHAVQGQLESMHQKCKESDAMIQCALAPLYAARRRSRLRVMLRIVDIDNQSPDRAGGQKRYDLAVDRMSQVTVRNAPGIGLKGGGSFNFDYVFDRTDDEHVSTVLRPLVANVSQGHISGIICDGYSGSGKSTSAFFIASRVSVMLLQCDERKHLEMRCSQFSTASEENLPTPKQTFLSRHNLQWCGEGIEAHYIAEDQGAVFALLEHFKETRASSQTQNNASSSRLHMKLEIWTRGDVKAARRRACLTLIDLAGGETPGDAQDGEETIAINKSRHDVRLLFREYSTWDGTEKNSFRFRRNQFYRVFQNMMPETSITHLNLVYLGHVNVQHDFQTATLPTLQFAADL